MTSTESYFHTFQEAIENMLANQPLMFDKNGYLTFMQFNNSLSHLPYEKKIVLQTEYNTACRNFGLEHVTPVCCIGMDTDFCTTRCAYATNTVFSNKA